MTAPARSPVLGPFSLRASDQAQADAAEGIGREESAYANAQIDQSTGLTRAAWRATRLTTRIRACNWIGSLPA